MEIKGWTCYNHAALSTAAPHEAPDTRPVESGEIWKLSGKPLMARWTTDYDCGRETQWWYEIKDAPFDPAELKAKRRYEISKGEKNFRVCRIDPAEYAEALCEVQTAAFAVYPKKYRPTVDRARFLTEARGWTDRVYGAFHRENGALCGYARIEPQGKCLRFTVQKTDPAQEKNAVNAALVAGILADCRAELASGSYICDGERPILHETNFQNYLEKYFGFRRAYCTLHVAYAPVFGAAVKLLFPLRRLLRRFDGIGAAHKLNAILRMEAAARGEKNE